MSKTSLTKLLAQTKPLARLLGQAADFVPENWCVEDPAGQVLFEKTPYGTLYDQPVFGENELVGRVKSASAGTASFIAALLENWLRQENEKRQIGTETLHLYREINLVFSFSEKLASSTQAEAVAQLALQEVRQIIHFSGACVLFLKENGDLSLMAEHDWPGLPEAFLREVASSGKSEIVAALGPPTLALCAALKLGQRTLGAVLLLGDTFSAADLKLLCTLAGQAAAALDNAARHERATAQALQAQREQLTLELAMKHPFFKKTMALIETHYTDPDFTVAVLSESLHLSASQLQRKIAGLTDLTPVQMIRDLRLARAKELLRGTDLSVAEVAFRAGFNDPSYFTRLFVKQLNATPSDWRRL